MRKWRCIKTKDKNVFTVGEFYESNDFGYCLKDDKGNKWIAYKMWEIEEH